MVNDNIKLDMYGDFEKFLLEKNKSLEKHELSDDDLVRMNYEVSFFIDYAKNLNNSIDQFVDTKVFEHLFKAYSFVNTMNNLPHYHDKLSSDLIDLESDIIKTYESTVIEQGLRNLFDYDTLKVKLDDKIKNINIFNIDETHFFDEFGTVVEHDLSYSNLKPLTLVKDVVEAYTSKNPMNVTPIDPNKVSILEDKNNLFVVNYDTYSDIIGYLNDDNLQLKNLDYVVNDGGEVCRKEGWMYNNDFNITPGGDVFNKRDSLVYSSFDSGKEFINLNNRFSDLYNFIDHSHLHSEEKLYLSSLIGKVKIQFGSVPNFDSFKTKFNSLVDLMTEDNDGLLGKSVYKS